jgi:hypothetical protein
VDERGGGEPDALVDIESLSALLPLIDESDLLRRRRQLRPMQEPAAAQMVQGVSGDDGGGDVRALLPASPFPPSSRLRFASSARTSWSMGFSPSAAIGPRTSHSGTAPQ